MIHSHSSLNVVVLYYRAYAVWGPSTVLTIFTLIIVIVRSPHISSVPEIRFEQALYLKGSAVGGFYITALFIDGTECACRVVQLHNHNECFVHRADVLVSPVRLMRSGCMFVYTNQIIWVALAIVIYSEIRELNSNHHVHPEKMTNSVPAVTLSLMLYKTFTNCAWPVLVPSLLLRCY